MWLNSKSHVSHDLKMRHSDISTQTVVFNSGEMSVIFRLDCFMGLLESCDTTVAKKDYYLPYFVLSQYVHKGLRHM